jgi:HPt (histidine-containing phosphotransfer) domain-containing protein
VPAIDPKTWNSLRALEAAGAPGFLQDLVREFLATVPDRLSKVRLALQNGDDDALEREAHAFKSSCGALGAMSAAGALDELETLGREKRASEGAAPLAALERDLDEACGELRTAVELP